VAQRLIPFGPSKILYHDIVEVAYAKDINAIYYKQIEEMLKEVDFLCITCNLTPQTKHKINKLTMGL
jgi:lactate dehydrogenase-like 2-hydroxyacid dehydrogenase